MLRQELTEGITAGPEEFEAISTKEIIREGRRKKSNSNGI